MTKRKIKSELDYESPYRLVRQLVKEAAETSGPPNLLLQAIKELDMAISRDKRKIRALKIELAKKK